MENNSNYIIIQALKKAYLKLHLNDQTYSDAEIADHLMDVLCNINGDDWFCEWMDSIDTQSSDQLFYQGEKIEPKIKTDEKLITESKWQDRILFIRKMSELSKQSTMHQRDLILEAFEKIQEISYELDKLLRR